MRVRTGRSLPDRLWKKGPDSAGRGSSGHPGAAALACAELACRRLYPMRGIRLSEIVRERTYVRAAALA